MKISVHQGDILKLEGVSAPVLVTSKDLFNSTKQIVAIPVFAEGSPGPLHIPIEFKKTKSTGVAHCEKLKLLDLNARSWTRTDRIDMPQIIEITDAIQSIFDYI